MSIHDSHPENKPDHSKNTFFYSQQSTPPAEKTPGISSFCNQKDLSEEPADMCLSQTEFQIQTHFIYHTIAAIRETVLDNPPYAYDLLYDFSVYLRALIREQGKRKSVSFEQELEIIKSYAELKKMHLGDRLTIRYEVNETAFSLPPLSIQPFVENAILHGIPAQEKTQAPILIRSFSDKNFYIVQIKDCGCGFDKESVFREIREGKRDSNGLSNAIKRLEAIKNASVYIDTAPGKGTCVTIRLPKS